MITKTVLAVSALVALTAMYNPPLYTGPVSDHFDGERFYNAVPMPDNIGDVLRWRLNSKAEPWPDAVPVTQQAVDSERAEDGQLRATFIGHATVLIQVDGLNIITDPIYAERASPVSFVGPKRVRKPGVAFDDLPPIDLVLVSHNHYDHLDLETLQRFKQRDNPMIVTGLGNDTWLRQRGFDRVAGLDWSQELEHKGIKLTFAKNQHWSARGVNDQRKTLWGGFVIEASEHKVYFAGDTGYGDFFAELGETFGGFDLALLPIGAFQPRWFMEYQHIGPVEAVQAHQDLKARRSMAIHFGTFNLADDGINEPAQQLQQVLSEQQLSTADFWVPVFGASYDIDTELAETRVARRDAAIEP